jgi:hypothetical protein
MPIDKIFSASPGSVALIKATNDNGKAPIPFSILIENEKWDYTKIQGIVTSMGMAHETNTQFAQTLSDDIYVTVFGSKVGGMSVSGILFLNSPGVCGADAGSAIPLESFYTKFLENCVITRKKHLSIQLGTVTLKGFLVAFQLNVTDAQTSFGNFTMQFVLLPRKK